MLLTEATTSEVTQDLVYVPASPEYLRPLARIQNAPTAAVAGLPLTLTAVDASQTLKSLGLGDQFDFVMGYNGADGTYTYEWYLGSVDPANKIADLNPNDGPRQITFVPQAPDDSSRPTFDVILVVTDTDSPNNSTSTATATLATGQLFLPAVQRP